MKKEAFKIKQQETENFELKEWKGSAPMDGDRGLYAYVNGIYNSQGGKIFIGVSDNGTVVGTKAIQNIPKVKEKVYNKLGIRIGINELTVEDKRVLELKIPSRPVGSFEQMPDGRAYIRTGESLRIMTSEQMKQILDETRSDFTAKICPGASIESIAPEALDELRNRWAEKTGDAQKIELSDEQLLIDLGLMDDGDFNYASIIIAGKKRAIKKYLPVSEVTFEYRNQENNTEYQARTDYREAAILYINDLWESIDGRNEVFHLQEDFFMKDIPAFNEKVVREAVLNAITHRDYEKTSQIFIKQSPSVITIESPGGFFGGVTPENIYKVPSTPRNRRLAEVFQTVGLVERSGQGADKIFRKSIEEGKGLPDYSESNDDWVKLRLNAAVQDIEFLKFLQTTTEDLERSLIVEDLILLEKIRREGSAKINRKDAKKFLSIGLIEAVGNTSGRRYILSRKYYKNVDRLGDRTRIEGVSRDMKKQLIIKHLEENNKGEMKEFKQIFPGLEQQNISNILQELKTENEIFYSQEGRCWKVNESK